MLKVLRKKGVMKKILWVVAVLIIVSFGLLGQIYLFKGSGKPTYAGKIFGQKISLEEYDYHLMQTRIQAMIQYGPNYRDIANFLNLYAQAWDRLILLHEANKRKIKVTDREVVQAIQSYGFFQKDGVFDKNLYQMILQNYFRLKPRDFEEGVRDSVKFVKIFEAETQGITIPEAEALELYKKANEKVQVHYALFSPDDYKNQVAYDEIKAKEYYLTHREEFMLPPMIRVDYIRIDYPPEALLDKKTPALPAESGESKDAALPPEEQKEVSAETKEATLKLAQSVARSLDENPDFSAVAKTFNLPAGTSEFFSLEEPDLSFGWSFAVIQGLFQLKPDQTIGPVETRDGYQILRLKERRESDIPDYPSAQDKVKEKWMRNAGLKIAAQKAEESLGKLKEALAGNPAAGFQAAAQSLGLTVSQTPLFHRGQYLPGIGLSENFQDAAFALTEDQKLSTAVETERGYCILFLDSFEPVKNEQFLKEKDDFTASLLQNRKNEFFNEYLIRLRLKADLKDNIPELKGQDEL